MNTAAHRLLGGEQLADPRIAKIGIRHHQSGDRTGGQELTLEYDGRCPRAQQLRAITAISQKADAAGSGVGQRCHAVDTAIFIAVHTWHRALRRCRAANSPTRGPLCDASLPDHSSRQPDCTRSHH